VTGRSRSWTDVGGGQGRETLLVIFGERASLLVSSTRRVDVPRAPPTPPSSAGDPLGGPRPYSLQSPKLTLRDSAGTAENCLGPGWLVG
jgi:hypothetical protein